MHQCTRCTAALETPLVCTACGTLQTPEPDSTPFELLGWKLDEEIDPRELRRRFLRFSRMTHPDFFADGSPAVKAQAEHNSALLNEAHDILSDDVRRADWLVRHLGGPDEIEERQMPRAFLMEVLDWNETLDEARKAASDVDGSAFDAHVGAKLSELEHTLNDNRAGEVAALRTQLTPLPARGSSVLREARKRLNAIRYLDRALSELEALRLSRPSTR